MDIHDTGPAAPVPTPPPTGVWNRWSDRRLLALAILMLAGNFVLQIAFFGLTDELFLPALIGSLFGVVLPAAIAARAANSNLIDDFQLGPIAPQFLLWSALLALAGLEPTSLLAGLSSPKPKKKVKSSSAATSSSAASPTSGECLGRPITSTPFCA